MAAAEDGSAWSQITEVSEVKRKIQSLFLRLFKLARISGFLSTGVGQTIFEMCYDKYKAWIEAGDVDCLASLVKPGATIVDVGANIGFFTRRFACWVSSGGRVLAIEPEAANYHSLTRMVRKRNLGSIVEPIHVAANDEVGTVRLHLDSFHPGGHSIGNDGVVVSAYTLDHLLSQRGWSTIGLVKIDVQGAEERVLRGMRETLLRFRPALFIEIDPQALTEMGSSTDSLLQFLAHFDYNVHHIEKGAFSQALGRSEIRARLCHGYTDFLFLAT